MSIFSIFQMKTVFFLEKEELIKLRYEIPKFFPTDNPLKTYKTNDEHFDSIGFLPVNDQTFTKIIYFWDYYEGLTFFTPKDVDKELFKKSYIIKPQVDGEGFIVANYAESVFNKGHDTDSLVFSYGPDYDDHNLNIVLYNIDKGNQQSNLDWFMW